MKRYLPFLIFCLPVYAETPQEENPPKSRLNQKSDKGEEGMQASKKTEPLESPKSKYKYHGQAVEVDTD